MTSHHTRSFPFLASAAVLAISLLSAASVQAQDALQLGYDNISSSGTGTTALSGTNVNTLVGANTFYNAGYTGSRAIIGNVEGGLIWNGHATLTQDSTQIYSPNTVSDYDFHATWVGSMLNGQAPTNGDPSGYYDTGIATGSTVWSAAVAAQYVGGGSTGFYYTNYRVAYAYENTMTSALEGTKANVINSSWGYTDNGGTSFITQFVDALAYQNGTVVVGSAGNNGYGTNSVGGIAAGYNSISVGATVTDTTGYQSVASFSSGGPSDYISPSGTTVSGARATVDLVAPGSALTLAFYQGLTGGNTGSSSGTAALQSGQSVVTPTGGNATTDSFATNLAGTSFSAPIVAGGAALLVDAGKAVYSSNSNAIDGRVIKAVLMNSADKLAGFNNGTTAQAGTGVLLTTQALDYSQGAGQMDLTKAYAQYISGDHGLTLNNGTTTISSIGWDYNSIALSASNNYNFATSLVGGSTLTATLSWFVANSDVYTSTSATAYPTDAEATTDRFDNLYLSLYQIVSPGTYQLIAESAANYITTQQIFMTVPTTGNYFLQVTDAGQQYNDGTITGNTNYALAWSSSFTGAASAPEPGSALLFAPFGLGILGTIARRRRAA